MLGSLRYKILWLRLKQRLFGSKLDIEESWRDTPEELTDIVGFLNWFDVTDSVQSTIDKAKIDWVYRFRNHPVFQKINHRKALEIGFGGGRLLMQAAEDFDKVIGVDIHKNFAMSDFFLSSNGIKNYELISKSDLDNIENCSIDLIYSFIVFQHFGSLEEVEFYLNHIGRLLSPNGVSIIYYGKNKESGIELRTPENFRLRDCSLFINPEEMRRIIDSKFEILDFKDFLPRDAVSNTGESVQSLIVFKKKFNS